MRFQVNQVLDAIEQRLTTDVTGAQAVADLGEIVRHVGLDRGRPVNLVRIGMVVDALARYLVDGGALLYGVVGRDLLSEAALTSKERMVLGRWAGDGRIEVVPELGERVLEVTDLTGLPLITHTPRPGLAGRYAWLADGGGRVLRLTVRAGVAVLSPQSGESPGLPADGPAPTVQGRASVPAKEPSHVEGGSGSAGPEVEPAVEAEPDLAAAEPEPRETGPDPSEADPDPPGEEGDPAAPEEGEPAAPEEELPLPLAVFGSRGAVPVARTRISWHRFLRDEPAGPHAALLRREWRCEAFECAAFGEYRQLGQPVPTLRGGVALCPRHGEPLTDLGPRRPAYPASLIIDDLPRRRWVVRDNCPVSVGRAEEDPPELVSVAPWLHQAATRWISPVHLRLEAGEEGLRVTDVSERGAVLWQRKGPDDPGTTRPLHQEPYLLGEWDSVELYTGVEVARGDRRRAIALGRDEPKSVLIDAPTAAYHQV